jgi:hypothetical protein
MTRPVVRFAVPAVLLAAGLVFRPADAQPLPGNSPLRYVPADAAVFVHAEAAALWGGKLGQAVRGADPKATAGLTEQAKQLFGVTPEQLKTVTAFWPKVKEQADLERFGVVVVFNTPFDKAALEVGLANVPGDVRVEKKDPTTAVVLIGLPAASAAPRPADAGPLTPYLREAATGKHVVAVGATLASLPDEIRGDTLPPDVQPFAPLLRATAAAAFLDVGTDIALDVRVTAPTPPRAVDAEKALGGLVAVTRQAVEAIPERELADPAVKNLVVVLNALKAGLGKATFATTGTEARARAAIPAALPLGPAAGEAVAKVKAAAARSRSFNNLKQIAIALHSYHDAMGSLPPAAVVDKTGRPLLSWRVLILPYVEQGPLYQRFKLDEPWDGPTNKKLIDPMPKVFAAPFPTAAKATETHYQAFVGRGAAFDLLKGPTLVQFTDGNSNTVLVGTAAKAVPWTKPDDMAFDPAGDMTTVLGFFPDVAHVAFGDGSVRAVPKTITRQRLRALVTRAGGEVIGPDDE